MDKHESGQVNIARRRFLNAARGAGALGAVAVLLGRSVTVQAAPPSPAATQDGQTGGGYRETEHIRKYYRSARYW